MKPTTAFVEFVSMMLRRQKETQSSVVSKPRNGVDAAEGDPFLPGVTLRKRDHGAESEKASPSTHTETRDSKLLLPGVIWSRAR